MGYLDYRFFVTDVAWLVGWGFVLGIGLVVVAFAVGALIVLLALALVAALFAGMYLLAYFATGLPALAGISALPAIAYLAGMLVSSAWTYFSEEGFQPFWQEPFDWRWVGLSLALAGGFAFVRVLSRAVFGSQEPYYV